MKQAKQRVIALDYFRGLCILIVAINHSWIFSMPYTYLAGAGALWTSAAELFFLLSGITLMIVRGPSIRSDFKTVAKKIWRRNLNIYLIYVMIVAISIILSLSLPQNIAASAVGAPPQSQGLALLWQILSFQYTVGLASYLMYYSVYMILAPFVLRAALTRLWPVVLGGSAALFTLNSTHVIPQNVYSGFLIWQLYFVIGIVLARFRRPIINYFYSRPKTVIKNTVYGLSLLTLTSILISILSSAKVFSVVNKLALDGWLPLKARSAYLHFLNHKATLNSLFGDGRMGLLRPLAALLFLATGYLLYQQYKQSILRATGRYVNAMGRDTLWLFAAQAVVIPVMAALPVPHNFVFNLPMTTLLVVIMWQITQRKVIIAKAKNYMYGLKLSYDQAKYNYLQKDYE